MEDNLIYKITNRINGKSYVGRTKNLKARISQHKTHDYCRALHRAIKKYGIDNFDVVVLQDNLSFDDAAKLERELILSENTLTPNGYNLILETAQGRNPSPETRARMSSSQQKQKNRNKQTGFIGVKKKPTGFLTRVNYNKNIYYKYYKTDIEAAEAYDKINLYLRGEGCGLNFPEKKEEYLKEDLENFYEQFRYKSPQSSKFQGVAFHKLLKKWRAYYYENGKQIRIGNFLTEEEAHEAVKQFYI